MSVGTCRCWPLLQLPHPLAAQDIKNVDGPEVLVEQDWLKGQWVLGAAGTNLKYAAFRGVPYARSPVGSLRFKARALLPAVVTVNYRLVPLVFADMDSEGVPDNAGLKDLLVALPWERGNPAALGGDPRLVTVARHGAGAALAYYLILVSAGTGLARAAILQSGSALAQWAFTENNVESATELARCIATAASLAGNLPPLDEEAGVEVLRNATVQCSTCSGAMLPWWTPGSTSSAIGRSPQSLEQRSNDGQPE